MLIRGRGHGLAISVSPALGCTCYILALSKLQFDDLTKDVQNGGPQNSRLGRPSWRRRLAGVRARAGDSFLGLPGPQWLARLSSSPKRIKDGPLVSTSRAFGSTNTVSLRSSGCLHASKIILLGCTACHQIHMSCSPIRAHRKIGVQAADFEGHQGLLLEGPWLLV